MNKLQFKKYKMLRRLMLVRVEFGIRFLMSINGFANNISNSFGRITIFLQHFSGSFYEQIDGVGMGSPIAPAFADIFMNYVIEKTKKFNVQPDVFLWNLDDCFAVFPYFESVMLFHRKLTKSTITSNLPTNLKTINSYPSWTSMLTIYKKIRVIHLQKTNPHWAV